MNKICILTGAGISAESGIKTFRDADGLWEGHDVMQVASPEGWQANSELVLDFYNQRRAQLKEVMPNLGHFSIVKLEKYFDTVVITQNVDNLHEKAGSQQVIHLHGELTKVRSTKSHHLVYEWEKDLNLGDLCEDGHQLRPHIVWFGEQVPMLDSAIKELRNCDICLVIGTSMQVYPAAALVSYVPDHTLIYYIDPKPSLNHELNALGDRLEIISERATIGVPSLVTKLIDGISI